MTFQSWCEGAYLYKDEAEKNAVAAAILFVPGGHKHWSGGDRRKRGVYEQGSGKFDTVPAK